MRANEADDREVGFFSFTSDVHYRFSTSLNRIEFPVFVFLKDHNIEPVVPEYPL